MTHKALTGRIEAAGVAYLGDHPANAYKASTTVFLPETRNTSVTLKSGEHLFILTDNGVEEAPHVGPQEILLITEHFGCWPVVAIRVRAAHVDAWRNLPQGVHELFMKRVRAALRARTGDDG